MKTRFSTSAGQQPLSDLWETTKKTAAEIRKSPTVLESLKRWWIKKYKLPSNHECFVSQTLFELLVEYHSDYFESNPLEVHRQADGEIQFTDTGDSLIDKWEQDLADGILPDLTEAFSEGSLEKIKARLDRTKGIGPQSFGDIQKQNDMLARIEQAAKDQGLFNPNNYKTF